MPRLPPVSRHLTDLPLPDHFHSVRPSTLACFAGFALAAALASCAPVSRFDPASGRVVAASASPVFDALGVGEFNRYKRTHKVSTDPALKARAERVVQRLTPHIDQPDTRWEVVVFDDKTPNAFALPGGKIGVHSGIFPITANDAGLAAALGHEIAHLTLHHAQDRVNQVTAAVILTAVVDVVLASHGVPGGTQAVAAGACGIGSALGWLLPRSRAVELEADHLGTLYMARAGYDPREAPALWRRFARYRAAKGQFHLPEFLRTHPLDQTRIQALDDFVPVARKEARERQSR